MEIVKQFDMDNNVYFESAEFTTVKGSKEAMRKMKQALCEWMGVESRSNVRIPHGTIMINGKYNGSWISLTDRIGDFSEKINSENWSEFKLMTRTLSKK